MKKTKLAILVASMFLMAGCNNGGDTKKEEGGNTPDPSGHHFSTEWSKDDTNHWHACTDEGCTETSGKAEHSLGNYTDNGDGTHSSTCVCGFVKKENHVWDNGVETTKPTDSTPGVRTYTCTKCSATRTEPIPVVTKSIKIGETNLGVDEWNTKFPNALASESGAAGAKVLTITLNGNQELDYTEYLEYLVEGADATRQDVGIDFRAYSKVLITGEGTLNVKYDDSHDEFKGSPAVGFITNEFVVDENVVLNMNGVSYGPTNKTKYYAAIKAQNLVIKGTLATENYCTGIVITSTGGAATMDIESTGSVTISKAICGIFTLSATTFNNAGNLSITTVGTNSSYYGFYCNAASILKFTGNSVTVIDNVGYGMHGNSNKISIYMQDSAKFTLTTSYQGLVNYTKLIVGNGDDGATQCSAEVTLVNTAKTQPLLVVKPVGEASLTVFNSSKDVTLEKSGATPTKSAIVVNTGSHVMKLISNTYFKNYATLIEFTGTPTFEEGAFVAEDGSGNATVKVDSVFTADFVGTLPENVPSAINKRS